MPSAHHARSPFMSDGKWSGCNVKPACGFKSLVHTSDPVNQPTGVREKENKWKEKKVKTERHLKKGDVERKKNK